jgi:hypothetical protein
VGPDQELVAHRSKGVFNSVFFSRRLADVMDDAGRKRVLTPVCNEIAGRSFDEANEIMVAVGKIAADYFGAVGITLDFIGRADTSTFDRPVQEAVNRRYIATQDQAIAALLTPYAATIQTPAVAEALGSFGQKTDAKLPTELGTLLGTLLKSGPAGPAPHAP